MEITKNPQQAVNSLTFEEYGKSQEDMVSGNYSRFELIFTYTPTHTFLSGFPYAMTSESQQQGKLSY